MDTLHFNSVKEFYPYYLTQHRDVKCRAFHFVGTAGVIAIFIISLATQKWWLFVLLPVVGYGFAWAGHFRFEKNKPAALNNPLYSLACDFIMFWHILTGEINERLKLADSLFNKD